jgi:two-component system, NarL family, nitrate/nitrite response regulator NarL
MPQTILIVDDHRGIRQSCRMLLELEGFLVTEATSWVSFNEVFFHGEKRPDLVLFDINLGTSVSGDKLVEVLKKGREQLASEDQCKLVLFSSLPEEDVAARSKKCGADGYIVKDALAKKGGAPFVEKVRSYLK